MLRLLFASLLSLLLTGSLHAQSIRVITEEWPPYNFRENGNPAGLTVEMVEEILKEADIAARFEFMPWDRAYNTALNTPNTLLFTLARDKGREPSFHWLLKVAVREMWFYSLSGRKDIAISHPGDLHRYTIGTGALQDKSTQDLIAAGFADNLDTVQSQDSDTTNLRKLLAKRFDLMYANPVAIAYSARKLGISLTEIRAIFPGLSNGPDYWIALSSGSDPILLAKLSAAVRTLEKRGVFTQIRARYGITKPINPAKTAR